MRVITAFVYTLFVSFCCLANNLTINLQAEILQSNISQYTVGESFDITLQYSSSITGPFNIGQHQFNTFDDNDIGSHITVTFSDGTTITTTNGINPRVSIHSQAIGLLNDLHRYSNDFTSNQLIVAGPTVLPNIDILGLHLDQVIYYTPLSYKKTWSTNLDDYQVKEFYIGNSMGDEIIAKITNITTSAPVSPSKPELFTVNFKATVSHVENSAVMLGEVVEATLSYDIDKDTSAHTGLNYWDTDLTLGAGISVTLADGSVFDSNFKHQNFFEFLTMSSDTIDHYNGNFTRNMIFNSEVAKFTPTHMLSNPTQSPAFTASFFFKEDFSSTPSPLKDSWSINLNDYEEATIDLYSFNNGQQSLIIADITEISIGEPILPSTNITLSGSVDNVNIPASGGTLNFSTQIDNPNLSTVPFLFWEFITMPDGTHFNISTATTSTLNANDSNAVNSSFLVPGYWPDGTYTFKANSMIVGTGTTAISEVNFVKGSP